MTPEIDENPLFDAWHSELTTLARTFRCNVQDRDAWFPEFERGATVEEAFFEEYPEHASTHYKQHKTPCKECPWKRTSAAGWLGASEPGEFLKLSDSGKRMPCHMAGIDYESDNWREQAETAPQCAGRAIFLSNRCQLPATGTLKLPADRDLVFSRPHEFVAHHARRDPEELATTMVYDLYQVTK